MKVALVVRRMVVTVACAAATLSAPLRAQSTAGGAASRDRSLRDWVQSARISETRAEAVDRFRNATARDLPELHLLLAEARRVPGEGVARMLEDPRHACRPAVPNTDAWLACLLENLQGKTTINAKSAVEFACVLLGARAVKTIDGQALAASMALDARGAFESAVGLTLKAGGDEAIAALYMVRRDGSPPLKKWAAARLDGLHRRRPADVATLGNAAALARVIDVFGAWRDPEALGLIVERVDADRREVRSAARAALRAYGREGIWKLREALREVSGEAAPDDWFSKRLADELFARLDKRRLGPAMDSLEKARDLSKSGQTREAAEAAEHALLLAPDHPERKELATYLLARGTDPSLAAGARARILDHAVWAGGEEISASIAANSLTAGAQHPATGDVAGGTTAGGGSVANLATAGATRSPSQMALLYLLALCTLIFGIGGETLRRSERAKRLGTAGPAAAEDVTREELP